MAPRLIDVVIVGGGPAGLTAAVYLARSLRSVLVLDGEEARAALIPLSRNCPGFPEGVGGEELLHRLRRQATEYGARIEPTNVEAIDAVHRGFVLWTGSGVVQAPFVILATGMVDKVPEIPGFREGIAAGSIRLCPVCDGYEARDKHIGVVGEEHSALSEASFLRTYSERVSILSNYVEDVGQEVRQEARAQGIEIWDTVDDIALVEGGLDVALADGSVRHLDVLYSAMGCEVRSGLARSLGVDCDDDGYIQVGSYQETNVPGLYAVGDVVSGLNLLTVGFGQAATAAAHIHKALREMKPCPSAAAST